MMFEKKLNITYQIYDQELDDKATVNQQLTVQNLLQPDSKQYRKYKAKTLDNVEKDYLVSVRSFRTETT